MRKIIDGDLVSVASIDDNKAFITFEEAERILKSKASFIPDINLIGCNETILNLKNLNQLKTNSEIRCYIVGDVEEFQTESELSYSFWELERKCINNIKGKLMEIGKPVTGSQLGWASKFDEGGQATRIERLFLDISWNIWIENQHGGLQSFNEAVNNNSIPLQRSLSILRQLEVISSERRN